MTNLFQDIDDWIDRSRVRKVGMEHLIANESLLADKSMSEDPEMSMKVTLVNDALIEKSGLKRVTNQIAFSKGAVPTDDGIFSTRIFGSTPEERQRTFGYIDLIEKFFHPYVYEILKALIPKKFEKCASGMGSWHIDKDGQLVEVDEDSEYYDYDNTGVKFLVDNFKSLKLKETDALARKDRLTFIRSLGDDELFITKWIVLPVFYRDLDKNSATYKLPELDVEYNNLIRYANSLEGSIFSFDNNRSRFNVQRELVTIRKRGQSLLEKKHGFFHKAILGKSIDRGSRDVISTVTLNECQRPEDNPIDIFTSGFPLSKCMVMGYDFIMRYCLQFFNDNFRDIRKYPIYNESNGEYKLVGEIPIKNQLEIFTSSFIEKKITQFKNSHETRFDLIEMESEGGGKIPIHFTGQFSPLSKHGKGATTIINRPMTWTDLFYMAAYNTLTDKSVYITRFPVTSHNSIYPTKCFPLSTIRTCSAIIEGVEYKHYPVIDLTDKTKNISNQFNDTVTFSNLFLAAIGGDFDGDTTSNSMVYSLEANVEAEEIATAIKSFVTPDGKLLRTLGNEAYLTFYNMTRDNPPAPPLSHDLKQELLRLKKDSLTIKSIGKLFGITTSMKKGDKNRTFNKIPPKFNPQSKFVLMAGEYGNKTTITTTVGKFLFNKLLIEDNLEGIVENGYINQEVNKKIFSNLTDTIATALTNREIFVKPHMAKFLSANEFWGLSLVTIFATSYSKETLIPNKNVLAMKKKLLADRKDDSLQTLVDIEDRLIDQAKKELAGNPGKFLYDSGARGSFENDYKNMAISVGPVENQITKKNDFMQSNYMDGIAKQDLVAAANSIVAAEYPKAIGTAEGGYMVKQFYAVYQNIMIDDPNTNCGTTRGVTLTITKANLNDYVDQYIITNKGLVIVDKNLSSEYMNKPIMLRSPMYCLSEKLCNKCAGERFYKIGIDNIGLTTPAISGSLMNASLKFRHSMKMKMDVVDINKLLL